MKTWWQLLLEIRPGLEKYPGSLMKPVVLRAQNGDAHAIGLLKTWNVWDEIHGHPELVRRIAATSGLIPAFGINVCEIIETDASGRPESGVVLGNFDDPAAARAELERLEGSAAENHEFARFALVFPDGRW